MIEIGNPYTIMETMVEAIPQNFFLLSPWNESMEESTFAVKTARLIKRLLRFSSSLY